MGKEAPSISLANDASVFMHSSSFGCTRDSLWREPLWTILELTKVDSLISMGAFALGVKSQT